MAAVTTHASGRHHQPRLVQGPAVHALLVVGHHAVLGTAVALISHPTLVVALAAKVGNIAHVVGRFGIVMGQNVMSTAIDNMAIKAVGRIRITLVIHLAVNTGVEYFHHFGVTNGTIHFAGDGITRTLVPG